MKARIKMINKISLRVKITLVATVIMIFISVILTAISVYNANVTFLPAINNINTGSIYKSSIVDLDNTNNDKLESIDKLDDSNTHYRESIDGTTLTHSFKNTAILYMMFVIILGSILIYFILDKMLKPIKRLSRQIEIINEYQLSQRIDGFSSGDELSELQDSFNTMLDRLDKAFEVRKRFSSDAAHELKTPLAVLKTNLDVLSLDENPTKEDYEYTVAVFKKQTERMINLVNNLFNLSLQKDYDFNDIVNFDIVIDGIIKDLENEIRSKNLSINFERSNLFIKGNSTMLTHAISNLIQNAVKYNNKNGNINIEVKENDKIYIITIKDTGIGIEEDKENEIFEPFYRVDTSRSRKVGGAGLGLAITRDVVSRHGGTVNYAPNESGGSIFQITLPLIKN